MLKPYLVALILNSVPSVIGSYLIVYVEVSTMHYIIYSIIYYGNN
jgi:hypothetical protein